MRNGPDWQQKRWLVKETRVCKMLEVGKLAFRLESLRKSAATELYGSVAIWGKMAMGVIGIATGGKCRGKEVR